jgi:S-adenosylmethionine hydrolase
MSAIITLTTDFGLSDAYTAEMKGVILGINPDVKFVDICHTIKPQNITQAAFVLSTAYRFFPERTIHIVVVDPGVGSERRAVLLRTPLADFVAPDNGVLSYIVQEVADKSVTGGAVKLRQGTTAISLTNPEFWLRQVSSTFHGRDVFAPVAAHLSLGTPPADFGEPINTLVTMPLLYPHKTANGLTGHIVHIDNFGNLITNINGQELPQAEDGIGVLVGGKRIPGLCHTYAEGSGLLALVGSHGYLEIALKNGNAASFLGVGTGDQVRISVQTGGRQ